MTDPTKRQAIPTLATEPLVGSNGAPIATFYIDVHARLRAPSPSILERLGAAVLECAPGATEDARALVDALAEAIAASPIRQLGEVFGPDPVTVTLPACPPAVHRGAWVARKTCAAGPRYDAGDTHCGDMRLVEYSSADGALSALETRLLRSLADVVKLRSEIKGACL